MKKLITSLALMATMLSASAADVINVAALLQANPDATKSELEDPMTANYDADFTFGNNFNLTGESGATYEVINIAVVDASPITYFRFPWNYDLSSNVHGGLEGKYIQSVEIKTWNNSNADIKLYASEGEFDCTTWDGRDGAAFKYDEYDVRPLSGKITIPVNVPCNYFALSCSQTNVQSITINWTDEKPVPTVMKPEISCWANPVEVGSSVSIKTATVGATINASVYVNDELAANQPEAWVQDSEWSSMTVTLPGKAGDKVRVEAYASKTDWAESETAIWECASLAMSPAPRPSITKVGSDESYISYVLPGEQIQIAVNTTGDNGESVALEGAKVVYVYGWNDWENEENSFRSEEFEAAAPAVFTVPANAPVGVSFYVEAVATAEGYRESNKNELYTSVISPVLPAPSFSHQDGAMLKAGGALTIYRPDRATEIHYTVNGGEEQVSDAYTVEIPVVEEITVVAWATGNAPFEPSEKVTVSVSTEKFEAWMDVINCYTFGMSNDETDSTSKIYDSVLTNAETGVHYEYYGGFWQRTIDGEDVNCFYMNGRSSADIPYIRSTVPAINTTGDEVPVNSVMLDSYLGTGFFVFLSNEKIELKDEMTNYDYDGTETVRFTIVGDDNVGSDYSDYVAAPGVMVKLSEVQKMLGNDEVKYDDKKYIAIAPVLANQGYYLSRAVIGYCNPNTAAELVSADALNGDEVLYNLNGLQVKADNLTPGIYVRVANGKTSKILVK